MTLPKMDPTWKKRWVEALRSGEFKQGRHALYDEDYNAYCCLGVLEKIVVGENPPPNGYLSPETAEIVGLPKDPTHINESEVESRLINFNDGKERSFPWIAAYIERYL